MKPRLLFKQAIGNAKNNKLFYTVIFLFTLFCAALVNGMITFVLNANNEVSNFHSINNSLGIFNGQTMAKQSDVKIKNNLELKDSVFNAFIDKVEYDFNITFNDSENNEDEFLQEWSKNNFNLAYLGHLHDLYDDSDANNDVSDVVNNVQNFGNNYFLYFLNSLDESTFSQNSNFIKYADFMQDLSIENYEVFRDAEFINNNTENNNDIIIELNPALTYENFKLSKDINEPVVYKTLKESKNPQPNLPTVYISPAFARIYKLKLGDIMEITIQNSQFSDINNSQKFVVSGIMVSLTTISDSELKTDNRNFNIYVNDYDIFSNSDSNELGNVYLPLTNYKTSLFSDKLSTQEIKNKADVYFSQFFTEDTIKDSKLWSSFYDDLSDESEYYTNIFKKNSLVSLLCNVIIYIASALFIVVLIFSIMELVKKTRKSLIFLSSFGIYRPTLSLLSTVSTMVPVTIALLLSMILVAPFGSLMTSVYSTIINTNLSFWTNFNLMSFIITLVMLVIIFVIFYFVNLIALSYKKLKVNNVVRPPSFEMALNSVSRKIFAKNSSIKISFAYINHNIFKVLVTFIIMTIAFTVILFSLQFTISANVLSTNPTQINKYQYQVRNNFSVLNSNGYLAVDIKPFSQRSYLDDNLLEDIDSWIKDDSSKLSTNEMITKIDDTITEAATNNTNGILDSYITGDSILWLGENYPNIINNGSSVNVEIDDLTRIVLGKIKDIYDTYNDYDLNKLDNSVYLTFKNYYVGDSNTNQFAESKSFADFYAVTSFSNSNLKGISDIIAVDDQTPVNLKKIPSTQYENAFYYPSKNKDERILNVDVTLTQLEYTKKIKVGDIINANIIFGEYITRLIPVKLRINSINKENLSMNSIYVNKKAFYEYVYSHKLIPEDIFNRLKSDNFTTFDTVFQTNNYADSIIAKNFVVSPYKNDGTDLEDWEFNKTQNFNTSIIDFQKVGDEIYSNVSDMVILLRNIDFIVGIVIILVVIIVIKLVIMQNEKIILLLKTMGYKLHKVVFKLLGGYLFGSILSIIFGAVIAALIILLMRDFFITNFQLVLIFVNSWQFYTAVVSSIILFNIVLFWSMIITWNSLHPNQAFAALVD